MMYRQMNGTWTLKRVLSLIMALCMMVEILPVTAFARDSSEPLPAAGSPGAPTTVFSEFSDVGSSFAEPQIRDWVQKGLINGYPDGTFRPDSAVTRAEFVALINRAYGFGMAPQVPVGSFPDVASDTWYAKDVATAKAAGYIQGNPDGTFRPEDPIQRQEASAVLGRILNIPASSVPAKAFTDDSDIAEWSEAAILTLTSAGVIFGNPDGTFAPFRSLTRAEAVVLMDRGQKAESDIFDKQGSYGPVSGSRRLIGNVTVSAGGIVLKNLNIAGDLVVDVPAGSEDISLQGVSVTGTIIVKGKDVSLNLADCTIAGLSIGKDAAGTTVELAGSSTLATLTVDAAASITGSGRIGTASISSSGVTIAQDPGQVTLASGVTATVNGKKVTGTGAPVIAGGGGGDGGPTAPPSSYAVTIAVSDGLTGGVLSGAMVTLGAETATTDSAGRAVFSRANGSYSFTAIVASGYYACSGTVNVSGGAVTTDAALAPTGVSASGAFGPLSGTFAVPGNFTIASGGVTLRNTIINGNLVLDNAIGAGDVTLEHVTVTGSTLVAGGGSHSITLFDCALYTVTVDHDGVHVVVKGNTTVQQPVIIETGATLDATLNEGGGLRVTIPVSAASVSVGLSGDFSDVQVGAQNVVVDMNSGSVQNLTLGHGSDGTSVTLSAGANVTNLTAAAPVTVVGGGTIQNAQIDSPGVTLDQTPTQCALGNGVTAAVGGTDLTTSYYRVSFSIADSPAGASVTVGGTTVGAGASGIAVFSLPDGHYSYTATAPGYLPVSGAFTVSGQAVTRSVSLGLYDIIVTVTDRGTGLPIAGAEVTLGNAGSGSETLSTDGSGTAIFGRPNGSYIYNIAAQGYMEGQGTAAVAGASVNSSVSLALQLTSDTYEIGFHVADSQGDAVEGASISIDGAKVTKSTTTGADGLAAVSLPSGTYAFSIISTESGSSLGTIIVPGDTLKEVVLSETATDAYPVIINVKDAGGRSLVDVPVTVTSDGETDGVGAQTDLSGDAVFSLQNGAYSFGIAADGYEDYTDGSFTVNGAPVIQPVQLTAQALPPYPVIFQVAGPDGSPFDDATIKVGGQTGTSGGLGEPGQATFDLAAGTYPYTVEASGCVQSAGRVVVIGGGATVDVIMESERFSVTFAVEDSSSGKPVPGASVTVSGLTIGDVTVTTDLQGKAVLNLMNGTYEFSVAAIGYEPDPDQDLTVAGPGSTRVVELTRSVPTNVFQVTFTVTDAEDAPVQGALVTVGGVTTPTGSNGQAVFQLGDGCTYAYRVLAKGVLKAGGLVAVDGTDVTCGVHFAALSASFLASLMLSQSGDPGLTYNGATLYHDLSTLSLRGEDQYGDEYPLADQQVTWQVNGPASVSGSTLMITGYGTVGLTARIGSVASDELLLTINRADPVLSTLTLGNAPMLTYASAQTQVSYNLEGLSLIGKDQFGGAYDASGLTVTWRLVSGPAILSGTTLTIVGSGSISVQASIESITSNKLTLGVYSTPPALSRLELRGSPSLYYGVSPVAYDLRGLTLTGYSQYGGVYSLADSMISWTIAPDGPATLNTDGFTISITGLGTVNVTATAGSVYSNSLALNVSREAPYPKTLTLSVSTPPPLVYDGADLTYDLSGESSAISLSGIDQYGEGIDVDPTSVVWTVVSGEAVVSGHTLTVKDSEDVVIKATAGGAVSNNLTLPVERAESRLASIALTSDIPALYAQGDPFDLSALTVTGYDQFGDPYDFAGQTVTWIVTSGGSHAAIAGGTSLLAPTSNGSGMVTATVGSFVSNEVPFTVGPTQLTLLSGKLSDATALTFYEKSLVVRGTGPYTWDVVDGALPPQLTLNSNGTLSGPLTVNGSYHFTVSATDTTTHQTAEASLSLNVVLPIIPADWDWPSDWPVGQQYFAIMNNGGRMPDAYVGTPYRYFLQARGEVLPYKWTILDDELNHNVYGYVSLPDGLALDTTNNVIIGTPTQTGQFKIGLQVESHYANGDLAGEDWGFMDLNVYSGTPQALMVSGNDLLIGVVGKKYNGVIVSGGVAPYTYVVTGGGLPPGLDLQGDGKIAGTPASAGTYAFTLTATDSRYPHNQTGTGEVTITIVDPLEITTVAVFAEKGIPVSQTLSASGGIGPYEWYPVETLPAELTLDLDGTIGGITYLEVGQSYEMIVAVSDQTTHMEVVARVWLFVAEPLTITSSGTAGGSVGGMGYLELASSGGLGDERTWSISGGALPDGLTLNDRFIRGTPTKAGIYHLQVQVIDPLGVKAVKDVTFTITPSLQVVTTTLSSGTVGVPYRQALEAIGGTAPYTWTITLGALPPGLTLDESAGVVSGTPTEVTGVSLGVSVHDSTQPASQSAGGYIYINIQGEPIPLAVDTANLPGGTVGIQYQETLIRAKGGSAPYTWSVVEGELPQGFTLNSEGCLRGVPGTPGTYTFTVKVTDDQDATAEKALAIVIDPALRLTTTSLPAMQVGVYGETALTADGVPPFTWTVSGLPDELTFDPESAVIKGTPATEGVYTVTVRVTGGTGQGTQTDGASLVLTVNPTPLAVVTDSLPNGVQNAPVYQQNLTASGGSLPSGGYTWSIADGSLPNGLHLDRDGTIRGIPTEAGMFQFTVQVQDGWQPANTAQKALSVTVLPQLIISSGSDLPAGVAGTLYTRALTVAGGVAPYAWSVEGALPAGLTLNSTTGVIGGTPAATAGQTYAFTVRVSDSGDPLQSFAAAMRITILPGLSITTSTLYAGQVGAPYQYILQARDGTAPYKWDVVAGTLPDGLALDRFTGTFSGRPAAAGGYSFTVRVTDSASPARSSTAALSLRIDPSQLRGMTAALSDGMVGFPYSGNVIAVGGNPPYSWQVTEGALPAGLSLDAATGVVSGMPNVPGSSEFTVRVTDNSDPRQTCDMNLSIRVIPAVLTASADVTNETVAPGKPYSKSLAALGGIPPYTWSVVAGTLPPGLTLDADAGVISGTPTTGGSYSFIVGLSDSGTPPERDEVGLYITVGPALTVTTVSLSGGAIGSPYSETLSCEWGQAPYTWSIVDGALPAGLALNELTGTISGTPTQAGIYPITVRATDSAKAPQTAEGTLAIDIGAAFSVTTASLPDGTADSIYSAVLQAAGGTKPYLWAVTDGSLPEGLSLNASTGAVSGAPSAAGAYSFTARATDNSNPARTATASLTMRVGAALTLTPAEPVLDNGHLDAEYGLQFLATGGMLPYAWSIVGGALPEGLTLDASTGAISGTPTVAGNFCFTVQVRDSAQPPAATYGTYVIRTYAPLAVVSANLPGAAAKAYFSQRLTATGGSGDVSWSVVQGALPDGLTLYRSGTIAGTPISAGTFNFTVRATDGGSGQTADADLSITVGAALTVQYGSLPEAPTGMAYPETALTATGGAGERTWTLASGTLPAGLTLDPSGLISGTPITAGTYSFTARVTDSGSPAQTALGYYSIHIVIGLAVMTQSLSDGGLNTEYRQILTAGYGRSPFTWSLVDGQGMLPPGLTLDEPTGVISGTPTSEGTYAFAVEVTDGGSPAQTATKTLSITIGAGTMRFATTSLPPANAGTAYEEALTVTGGTEPYTWAVTQGVLPPGLTLDTSTGVIGGTPTAGGNYFFQVRAADRPEPPEAPRTTSAVLSIWVQEALQIGGNLPAAGLNTPYDATLTVSGGVAPYTLSISSGALPAGLLMDGGGVFSGTPAQTGAYSFTVRAVDSTSQVGEQSNLSVTKALSIKVYALPRIITSGLSVGAVGSVYNETLRASQGTGVFTWQVTQGTLPAGLTLNGFTGIITGTPTAAGDYAFTVRATDVQISGAVSEQVLAITVYPALKVTTVSLPSATQRISYSQTLSAFGGTTPYTWSVSLGSLPPGLSLNASTGAIGGTPTASGVFSFTVKATCGNGLAQSATAALSVTVNAALAISTAGLPSGRADSFYSQTLTASGGTAPYTWTLLGALPDGLSLSPDGILCGTPSMPGTYLFVVRVQDSAGTGQTAYVSMSLIVDERLSVSTTGLPEGKVGANYSAPLSTLGGAEPFTWSIVGGALPDGLTLNPAAGLISGKPTAMGTFSFTVQVTDQGSTAQTVTATLSITVKPSLTLLTSGLPDGGLPGGRVAAAYGQTLTASGGKTPYTWGVSGTLPPGLNLDASTGAISGTPTQPGSYIFTIAVVDNSVPAQLATGSFTMQIAPAKLAISTVSLPPAIYGAPYRQTLMATGGNTPYSWAFESGSLPPGLSLDPSTGVISGTPAATGSYTVVPKTQDRAGQVETGATLTLQVAAMQVSAETEDVTQEGFVLTIRPSVPGLTTSNFHMTDSHGNDSAISSVVSTDDGATYRVNVGSVLVPGEPYALTITRDNYEFRLVHVQVAAPAGSPILTMDPSLAPDGTTLTLAFNKAVAAPPQAPAGFTVTGDGAADAVTAIALSADYQSVVLTLAVPLRGSAAVFVSYDPNQPDAHGGIRASDGSALSAFADAAVMTGGTTAAGMAAADLAAGKTASYAATHLQEAYGMTASEAAGALTQAGYTSPETATALREVYSSDAAAVAAALRAAGRTSSEIAEALGTALQADAVVVAAALRFAGYDAVAVSGALRDNFSPQLHDVAGGRTDAGAAYYMLQGGYSATDIAGALRQGFGDNVGSAADALTSTPVSLKFAAACAALSRVYGAEGLASWAYEEYGLDYAAQALCESGYSAVETCGYLRTLDAVISLTDAAQALNAAGYAVTDTIIALQVGFNPAIGDLALALRWNYSSTEVANGLATTAQAAPEEVAELMTHGPSYVPDYGLHAAPADICAFLHNHYVLTGAELAAALYQTGWTEANNGNGPRDDGYGLNQIVSGLEQYAGVTTAAGLTIILRGLGVSPTALADYLDHCDFRPSGTPTGNWRTVWISAYLQAGYTATDLAAWCRSTGSGDLGTPVLTVRQMNTAGCGLDEIALALRNVYVLVPAEAVAAITAAEPSWDVSDVTGSVTRVYGADSVAAVIQDMKAAGATAIQTASTLRDTLEISDAVLAATYMAQAGYGITDVLTATAAIYYGGRPSASALQALTQVMQDVYLQQQGGMTQILTALNVTDPGTAITVLHTAGFGLYNIVQILANAPYSQIGEQATALLSASGLFGAAEIVAEVQAVYGSDAVLVYAKWLKSSGKNASAVAAALKSSCGIAGPVQQASYLNQAGFTRVDTLAAVYGLSPVAQTAYSVLTTVYGVTNELDMARELAAMYGGYSPTQFKPYINAADALSAIYSDKTTAALALLMKEAGFPTTSAQSADTIAWWLERRVQGCDDSVAAILGTRHAGDLGLSVGEAYGILNRGGSGYDGDRTAQWLLTDGFSVSDISAHIGGYPVLVTVRSAVSGSILSGIPVTFKSGSKTATVATNADGQAVCFGYEKTCTCTVALDGYDTAIKTFDNVGSGTQATISLLPKTHLATFAVRDGRGQPVPGIPIAVSDPGLGQIPAGIKNVTTGADGTAGIRLRDGVFAYSVSARGCDAVDGTLTVTGADLSWTITLSRQVAVSVVQLSSSGFTVTLSTAVPGLTVSNFSLLDGAGAAVGIASVSTSDGGATYLAQAALTIAQAYTLRLTAPSYTFTSEATVLWSDEEFSVGQVSVSGFTATFNPAVDGLTAANFTLEGGDENTVAVTSATTEDGGSTYRIAVTLNPTLTYTATLRIGSSAWTAQVLVPPTLTEASADSDGFQVRLTFDKPMVPPDGSADGFTVRLDGVQQTIVGASLSADNPFEIVLTLEKPLYGGTITLEYWPGGIHAVDTAPLGEISGMTVTNGIAPSALAYQLYLDGRTAAQTAQALKDAYGLNAARAATSMAGFYSAGDMTWALKSVFGQTMDQTAACLLGAGFGIGDVTNALHGTTYPDSSALTVAQALFLADANLRNICAAVWNSFGVTEEEMAHIFTTLVEPDPDDPGGPDLHLDDANILATLLEFYCGRSGWDSENVKKGLEQARIVAALREEGLTAFRLAAALQAGQTRYTVQAAATTMRMAGFGANEIAGTWASSCGTDVATARFLKDAGYGAAEVGAYLAGPSAFGDIADEAAAALGYAGYPWSDVAGMLLSIYSQDDVAAAATLQAAAGCTATDIAGALKGSSYGLDYSAAARILRGLGFSVGDNMTALLAVYYNEMSQGSHTSFVTAALCAAVNDGDVAGLVAALSVTFGYTVEEAAGFLTSGQIGDANGMKSALAGYLLAGYDRDSVARYMFDGSGMEWSVVVAQWKAAGVDAGTLFSLMQKYCPLLGAAEAAGLLTSSYGFDDTAQMVVEAYRSAETVLSSVLAVLLASESGPATSNRFKVLRNLGASLGAMANAQIVASGGLDLENCDWLRSLNEAGYTAYDIAGWLRLDVCPSDAKVAVMLLRKVCHFTVPDIVSAIKSAYNLSAYDLFQTLMGAQSQYGLSMDADAIMEAMAEYAVDPVALAIQDMVTSGGNALAVAAALRHTFAYALNAASDPATRLIEYLLDAGFGEQEVLAAVLRIYGDATDATKANLFSAICSRSGKKLTADALLAAADASVPATGISVLRSANFTLNAIIGALKGYYKLKASDTIRELLEDGFYSQTDILTQVGLVYRGATTGALLEGAGAQTTPATGVQVLRSANFMLNGIVGALLDYYELDMTGAIQALQPLVQAGVYSDTDVLRQVELVYDGVTAGAVLDGEDAQTPASGIPVLRSANFTLNAIMEALKDYYELNSSEAIRELLNDNVYPQTDILIQVQMVYGSGLASALLEGAGAHTPANGIPVLRSADFTLNTIVEALKNYYELSSSEAMRELLNDHVFPVTDILAQVEMVYGSNLADALLDGAGAHLPATGIPVLRSANFMLNGIVEALRDHYGLSSSEAIRELLNDHVYLQTDITTQVEMVYGEGGAGLAGALLRGADAQTPASGIWLLRSADFTLYQITAALKNYYNLPSIAALNALLEAHVYSEDDILTQMGLLYEDSLPVLFIRTAVPYRSDGWIYDVIGALKQHFNITDLQEQVHICREVDIDENIIFDYLMDLYLGGPRWDNLYVVIPVMRAEYGWDLDTCFDKVETRCIGLQKCTYQHMANALMIVFQMSVADMAMKLKSRGFRVCDPTVATGGGGTIAEWLYYYTPQIRDDMLAAILGPSGLGMDVRLSAKLLARRGYTREEAAAWLQKGGYSAYETLLAVGQEFPPYLGYSTESMLAVKGLYSVGSIMAALTRIVGLGLSGPGFAFVQLLGAGYDQRELIQGLLQEGGASTAMAVNVMITSYVHSYYYKVPRISPDTAANTVYDIASTTPGITVSLVDISSGLIDAARGKYCHMEDIYGAVVSITARYLRTYLKDDSDADIIALNIMKEAGLSADEAAAILAEEGVGLSTWSIIKSVFAGGTDWMDAVFMLAGAGYGEYESACAIWNNEDYHMVIGLSILSSLVTRAVSAIRESTQVAQASQTIQNLKNLKNTLQRGYRCYMVSRDYIDW